jgi:hypothetical protein
VAVDGVDVPAAVSLPVAVYLIVVWALHIRPHRHHRTAKAVAFPVAAALVLATLLTPWPLPLTALVLAAMVAFSSVEAARA